MADHLSSALPLAITTPPKDVFRSSNPSVRLSGAPALLGQIVCKTAHLACICSIPVPWQTASRPLAGIHEHFVGLGNLNSLPCHRICVCAALSTTLVSRTFEVTVQ
ncbi:hypothetical protein C8035_v007917 [Colletotrichum spinosum]|uniref:Uncharacterized protein n=1 Tax=Colletotrichum spinosum TaxID=1347390 RepID=A0A4V3HSK1_9PEZI|nr:hypothetical protein C8035_v007917 [Colletotrichum spinosum]